MTVITFFEPRKGRVNEAHTPGPSRAHHRGEPKQQEQPVAVLKQGDRPPRRPCPFRLRVSEISPPPPPKSVKKSQQTTNKSADRFFSKTGSQCPGSQSQAPNTPSFWLLNSWSHVETQNISQFSKKNFRLSVSTWSLSKGVAVHSDGAAVYAWSCIFAGVGSIPTIYGPEFFDLQPKLSYSSQPDGKIVVACPAEKFDHWGTTNPRGPEMRLSLGSKNTSWCQSEEPK